MSERVDVESLRLTPAMRDALLGWAIRYAGRSNPTACALEARGLIEWGQAWGQGYRWSFTQKGMTVRAALARVMEVT